MEFFDGLSFREEDFPTTTSVEQCSCEETCASFLKPFYCYDEKTLANLLQGGLINDEQDIQLLRSKHISYMLHNLQSTLPAGFISLDASRPWICYWIVHALYLLDHEPVSHYSRLISFFQRIQNKTGGFGGGPGQMTQGAPNYAAVLTLASIGTPEAFNVIDRKAMYQHFLKCKHPSGGYCIHIDGEVDTRSTYTVICIARLLNILTPELTDGAAEYILQCQTYEGGFGGEPGNEAHGGYNFCAIAALLILKKAHLCKVSLLKHWLLSRQMRLEGGFQGRTNKLVDSCYSFWQGAAVAIVQIIEEQGDDVHDLNQYLIMKTRDHLRNSNSSNNNDNEAADEDEVEVESIGSDENIRTATNTSGDLLFNQKALQKYILHCGQNVELGGLRDKPNKTRDFYHTCYSLSGMSIAQNTIIRAPPDDPELVTAAMHCTNTSPSATDDVDDMLPEIDMHWKSKQVYGDINNLLEPTSVVFNIGLVKLKSTLEFFQSLPNTHEYLTH